MSVAVASDVRALTLAEASRIVREAQLPRLDPDLCETWVYAIQAGEDGPVKIGVAQDPCERIRTLQQGNPLTLYGIAAWRDRLAAEREIHDRFAATRIRGEWFEPTEELLVFVGVRGMFFGWDGR